VVSEPHQPLERLRKNGKAWRNSEFSQSHKADPGVALMQVDLKSGGQPRLQQFAVYREMEKKRFVPLLEMHEADGRPRPRKLGLARATEEGGCNAPDDPRRNLAEAIHDWPSNPGTRRIGQRVKGHDLDGHAHEIRLAGRHLPFSTFNTADSTMRPPDSLPVVVLDPDAMRMHPLDNGPFAQISGQRGGPLGIAARKRVLHGVCFLDDYHSIAYLMHQVLRRCACSRIITAVVFKPGRPRPSLSHLSTALLPIGNCIPQVAGEGCKLVYDHFSPLVSSRSTEWTAKSP
jgi:hypothetical protein